MFTDLRVKTLEMTEKKRSPLTWLQPHTLCCVCFSDAFAAWPAGRPSDVVHPTARRLCIHIKTSPGNHNTDAADYPRTAASGEPLTVSGMTHLHPDGAAATQVAAMKMQQSQSREPDHRFTSFPSTLASILTPRCGILKINDIFIQKCQWLAFSPLTLIQKHVNFQFSSRDSRRI